MPSLFLVCQGEFLIAEPLRPTSIFGIILKEWINLVYQLFESIQMLAVKPLIHKKMIDDSCSNYLVLNTNSLHILSSEYSWRYNISVVLSIRFKVAVQSGFKIFIVDYPVHIFL